MSRLLCERGSEDAFQDCEDGKLDGCFPGNERRNAARADSTRFAMSVSVINIIMDQGDSKG